MSRPANKSAPPRADSAPGIPPPRRAGGQAPVYSAAQYIRGQRQSPRARLLGDPAIQRRSIRRRRRNEWAWVVLAGGMISLFSFLVLGMFVFVRAPQAMQEVVPTADLTPPPPTAVDARSEYIDDGRRVGVDVLRLDDGSLIEMAAWDGQSRFTVIVGGLDRRPDQSGEPVRTDSLMLVSIDPASESIGLLSIPRDLWVRIPEQESRDRINRAYFLGESRATGYGPRLLQQTVSWNFGMRVHNYVILNFQALIDIVDQLGGVEVSIDYTIEDARYPDMNYGYDPFYLPPGTHLLDGYDALRFARTRHGNNDVTRAERQQQVLQGLRERALGMNFLELAARLPGILASLGEHVQTGLDLEEVVQLALLVKDFDAANITMRVMDFSYLQEHVTEEYQQQVLLPIVERLPALLTETFGSDYAR